MSETSDSEEKVEVDPAVEEAAPAATSVPAHGTLILDHVNPEAVHQGAYIPTALGRRLPLNSHIVTQDQHRWTTFKMNNMHDTIVRQRGMIRESKARIEEQERLLRLKSEYYKKQMKMLRRKVDHPDRNLMKSRLRK